VFSDLAHSDESEYNVCGNKRDLLRLKGTVAKIGFSFQRFWCKKP